MANATTTDPASAPTAPTEADVRLTLERVQSFKLHTLRSIPFYGTLALHAEFVIETECHYPLAATDGRRIFLNPRGMNALSRQEFDFVILHEVLHCAMLHIPRLRYRDRYLWNITTDCIINELCAEVPGMRAPHGVVRTATLLPQLKQTPRRNLHELAAEELYDLILDAAEKHAAAQGAPGKSGKGRGLPDLGDFADLQPNPDGNANGQGDDEGDGGARPGDQEAYWRAANNAAAVAQRMHESRAQGTTPAGVKRLMHEIESPQVDWRTLLWTYLVNHPSDYERYDRRFIQYEMYFDELHGQRLDVHVCIDTSGSIGDKELKVFLSELHGILRAHPHMNATLSWCDASLDGPHDISRGNDIPPPTGGGGTSFKPFFKHLDDTVRLHENAVAIYLTDGYGDFPDRSPIDTIWLIIPGGLESDKIPFGHVVRLHDT
jgi:predicted metal-dependent peptidase